MVRRKYFKDGDVDVEDQQANLLPVVEEQTLKMARYQKKKRGKEKEVPKATKVTSKDLNKEKVDLKPDLQTKEDGERSVLLESNLQEDCGH